MRESPVPLSHTLRATSLSPEVSSILDLHVGQKTQKNNLVEQLELINYS
jgi:hypothetical protein